MYIYVCREKEEEDDDNRREYKFNLQTFDRWQDMKGDDNLAYNQGAQQNKPEH
jgi:hypothetical protein